MALSGSERDERLAAIRGGNKERPVTSGVVADQSRNSRCGLLALANAAAVSLDNTLTQTRWQVAYGQPASAITRGRRFEERVKADGYAILLAIVREKLKINLPTPRIEDLRTRFPFDDAKNRYGTLQKRADETKRLVRLSLERHPEAPNLIDGAILTVDLAGRRGYLEADALALNVGGRLHVGEVKSFPVVDEKGDPEKIGSAADQTAVYVMALEDLVSSLGGKPETVVSPEVLLITPKNTGMQPVGNLVRVANRVRYHRRQLAEAHRGLELADSVPPGVSFPVPKVGEHASDTELQALRACVGNHYEPACLAFCGLSRWCREKAREAGDPAAVGSGALRVLPGVASLDRALELAEGAAPADTEATAASELARADRILEGVARLGAPAAHARRGRR